MMSKSNVSDIYEHYQTVCQQQISSRQKRDKLFIGMICSTFLLLLIAYDPEKTSDAIVSIFNNYGIELSYSSSILQTMLWVVCTYIFLRYIQMIVDIERRYLYLRDLERRLLFKGLEINQEGNHYSSEYVFAPKIINILYKYFFVSIYITSLVCKIILEVNVSITFVVDCVCLIVNVLLVVCYWLYLHYANKQY